MSEKKRLPRMVSDNRCESPHVVLLGAGASKAAFPDGDAEGVVVPLMQELTAALGAESLLAGLWEGPEEEFEGLFSRLHADNPDNPILQQLEGLVWDFFNSLKIPDRPTLYDHLLLSLRGKDLVATFNWDPFLALAYQRNRTLKALPRIVFLHGNVRVGACREHGRKGFFPEQRCGECGTRLAPVPLLYPVAQKDYAHDPFIRNEWEEIRHFMGEAYLLTIFGYGAPETDTEAMSLLLSAWSENETGELAEVEVINIEDRVVLEKKWDRFIVREHRQIWDSAWKSLAFSFPRRSCDAFAARTLMNRPWRGCPLPCFDSLAGLHEWVSPLIEEELRVAGSDDDFDPELCPASRDPRTELNFPPPPPFGT